MTEASTPTTFPRELESPFALLFPDLKPELAATRRILSHSGLVPLIARAMLTEMSLTELRKARELSQLEMAKKLKTTQSSISRLEHQADMYLSTLREYVEASGGHLDLIARYRDTEIRLTHFADLASA